MDVIAGDLGPENSRPGNQDSPNKPPYAPGQRAKSPDWDVANDSATSYDSTSASPSMNEVGADRNGDGCDDMMEKWRLIRLADRDKDKARKKIYPTHGAYAALLGKNYSKFFEAFQQGTSTPQAPKAVAATVPAKRSAAASKQAFKRRRPDDGASLPQPDQPPPRTIPALTSAATITEASVGAKTSTPASPSKVVEELSVTARPRSHSAAQEQRSKRKGVGIYAGNWEYATDEEKVPEYLSLAKETADLEGRTTRRAYARMTSKEGARNSGKPVGPSSGKEVRKSGRARNAVDYTRLSGPEDVDREIAAPEHIEEGRRSPAHETNKKSPSTAASSTSNTSTLMSDHPSRSTSRSTAINLEQPERPNLSWNAIVYEVLANSKNPLTFPQLVQGVKDRYPFFKSSSQEKVLKSGPKNPLYFHEAFCKGGIANGRQTWTLRPGEFIDKKTGEVLTPRPRRTIDTTRLTSQVRDALKDQSPVNMTSKLPQPYSSRSSNPRFGREILNSPEIPDSQEAKGPTSSPQEADSGIATEQAPHLAQTYQQTPPTVRQNPHELPDAADGTLGPASVGTSLSGQTSQSRFQWVTINGSALKTAPKSRSPIAAGTKAQSIQDSVGVIDVEEPAEVAQTPSASQAARPSAPSIPPSTGEGGHGSSPTTAQDVSTSAPLMHAVSRAHVLILPGDRAATSQTLVTPAASTHSVIPLAYTQLDNLLPDGKAAAKEKQTCTCNDASQSSATLSGHAHRCPSPRTAMLELLNGPSVH